MNAPRFSCALLALTLLGALPPGVAAATLNPVSYSMRNGDEGIAAYLDNTYSPGGPYSSGAQMTGGLGQLTDDILGGQAFYVDQGNGVAYEWVGWQSTIPDIVFDFGSVVQIDTAKPYADNWGGAGVGLFSSVLLYTSVDGVDFDPLPTYITPGAELADRSTARFIPIPIGVNTRYLRMAFSDSLTDGPWLMMAEIDFEGSSLAAAVPEPGTWAAGAVVGAAALGGMARRHRARSRAAAAEPSAKASA